VYIRLIGLQFKDVTLESNRRKVSDFTLIFLRGNFHWFLVSGVNQAGEVQQYFLIYGPVYNRWLMVMCMCYLNIFMLSLSQLLRIKGVTWSAQRIPAAVNLSFQDRSRYKVGTSFANKRRPLGRYSSLADYKPRSSVQFISFSCPINFHVLTRVAAHLPKLCRLKYEVVKKSCNLIHRFDG
jgi:hypothetical protein